MRNRAIRGCLIAIIWVVATAQVVYSKEVRGHLPQKLPEQQTNPSENQKPPAADNRGTADLPLIVKTIPSEKSQQEAENDARERDDKRWNDRTTLGIGALTLLILALQTIVFGLQAYRLDQTIKAMKKIGADQSRDMQASIAVANKAAEAAMQSAEVARQSMVTVQRAFVFIDHFEANVINSELSVMPKWRNSGATPTWFMKNWVSWGRFDNEPPDDFGFPDFDEHGNPVAESESKATLMFIGPNATLFAQQMIIPTVVMNEVRAGTKRVFLWGWARYYDVFGKAHITKYCNELKMIPVGFVAVAPGQPVQAAITFPLYRRHNCTDEECD